MRSCEGNRQDIMYPFMEFLGLFSVYTIFKGYKLKKAKVRGRCEARVEAHAAVVPPSAVTCTGRESNVEGRRQAVRGRGAVRLLTRDDDSGAKTLCAWW